MIRPWAVWAAMLCVAAREGGAVSMNPSCHPGGALAVGVRPRERGACAKARVPLRGRESKGARRVTPAERMWLRAASDPLCISCVRSSPWALMRPQQTMHHIFEASAGSSYSSRPRAWLTARWTKLGSEMEAAPARARAVSVDDD